MRSDQQGPAGPPGLEERAAAVLNAIMAGVLLLAALCFVIWQLIEKLSLVFVVASEGRADWGAWGDLVAALGSAGLIVWVASRFVRGLVRAIRTR